MNAPRQVLIQLLRGYGPSLCQNRQRCKGLLMDFCGQYRKEIFILISGIEEGIPQALLAPPSDLSQEAHLDALAQHLQRQRALTPEAARWGVESWALALGKVGEEQLPATETLSDPGLLSPAEMQLKEAIEQALNDDIITRQEKLSLRELSQRLAVPRERASQLFAQAKRSRRRSRSSGPLFLVVSPAGDGHFTSLAEALEQAPERARLLLRPGYYAEAGRLTRSIELIGDGPREEIVLQSLAAPAVLLEDPGVRVVLQGLTLLCQEGPRQGNFPALAMAQGELEMVDCQVLSGTDATLACVIIAGNSAPVLRQCDIVGSQGGVWLHSGGQGLLEHCRIVGHRGAAVQIGKEGNPLLRQCKLLDSSHGLLVTGQGKIERCQLLGNTFCGAEIGLGGSPLLSNCKIFNNPVGVWVSEQGRGRIENCHVFGNAKAGIEISQQSKPIITQNHIYRNGCAIWVHAGGEGVIVDNDLRDNAKGSLVKPLLSKLHYKRNKE